jgi:hypothetical protein
MIFHIKLACIISLMSCNRRRSRINPNRNEPISSLILHEYPNAVQARAGRGIPQIFTEIAHNPSFRETEFS